MNNEKIMPLKFLSSSSTDREYEAQLMVEPPDEAIRTPLEYLERRIPQKYIERFRISDEYQLEELKKIW